MRFSPRPAPPITDGAPPRRPTLSLALLVALLTLAAAPGAAADGFGRFQHGGRGVAQAGALVARADDPSAVFYNPAGIVDLDGVQVAAGVDFSRSEDAYRERFVQTDFFTGLPGTTYVAFDAESSWNTLPTAYVTWSDEERLGRWSLGLGVDAPFWYGVDWADNTFPVGIEYRRNELELWQLHPVAAYRLDGGWSVGGGLRYVFGTHLRGVTDRFLVEGSDRQSFGAVLFDDHEADVDGYGFDLAVRQRSDAWGFGAVLRSAVRVEGDGRQRLTVHTPPADPQAQSNLTALIADIGGRPFSTRLDLPPELAVGGWHAFSPALRVELDLVYTAWSDFEERRDGEDFSGNPYPMQVLIDGWDDTLAVRLGVERDWGEKVTLSAGVAVEPSPLPAGRVGSDWFRGDATVYAVGASFAAGALTWDVGYSYHDHDATKRTVVRPRFGTQDSRYESETQVVSVSLRARL